MLRVVLTVLLHGMMFLGLWWLQSQNTTAQPDDFAAGVDYWQQTMTPVMWGMLAFMLLSPALALLSCKRQSIRGRGLLLINWLFVPAILYAFHAHEQYMHYQIWLCWLVFSVVMLGIAVLNGLSARMARVPQQVGKK